MLLVVRKNKLMRGVRYFLGDVRGSRHFPRLRHRQSGMAVLWRSLRLLMVKT